ncbi:hypothetical protein AVEN_274054-1 [Araneus ventricosus]|uniref:Uncharacterized protein n=1 Tax=Araneus ventricosus TaxID=182803 RepID=A0A4Y2MDZ6_ARAVE|nr:hypothetical protein AVEN_274054-1 [Araneus ventricosus]
MIPLFFLNSRTEVTEEEAVDYRELDKNFSGKAIAPFSCGLSNRPRGLNSPKRILSDFISIEALSLKGEDTPTCLQLQPPTPLCR